MFTDYTHNCELEKIKQWFKENRLSLNVEKTNYTLFHKNPIKHKTPLKIPAFKVGNKIIERKSSIKLFGVMSDESLSWKDHIKTVENKLAKNVGFLYDTKQFLDETSFKIIYFSYIHSYLNYANNARASTYITKLKATKINHFTLFSHNLLVSSNIFLTIF